MKRLLAVGIISLSDKAISALRKNSINSLQELMIRRDLDFLTSEHFDDDVLQELLMACEKVDDFNEGLKREIVPNQAGDIIGNQEVNNVLGEPAPETKIVDRGLFSEGRRRFHQNMLRDLMSIANLEIPTSLRKAILKLMIDYSNKEFDRKRIKKILEEKYKSTISINSDAIRSILSSLESHMFIKRTNNPGHYKITKYTLDEFSKCAGAKNYFYENAKIKLSKEKELNDFIKNNIGQEIELRYKSERARSDKWWRRVRVYDQDDVYLYVADYYSSGGRVRYLKERIIEYRKIKNGEI